MANTYVYPTNAELTTIAQKFLPATELSSEILSMFPSRSIDESMVIWEQMDNYQGLMKPRGYNGPPGRRKAVGMTRFAMLPGVYGDYSSIDEEEITVERQYGTFNAPIDISTLVMRKMVQVTDADIRRREQLSWLLLTTGSYSVTDDKGAILDTKGYTVRTFVAAVPWATLATATPLADLRALKLLHRGFSVDFGRKAKILMNLNSVNNLLNNQNANDLGGKRRAGGSTFNSLADINQIFLDNDLPSVEAYDEGYLDDTGTFQPYIGNNVGVIKGLRTDGAPIGEWIMTRNANNPGAQPGVYAKVIDNIDRQVPRTIEVHRGFNGGPAVKFPSAIPIISM